MTFGIIGNTTKPTIREVLHSLILYLIEKKMAFFIHDTLWEWLVQSGLSLPLTDVKHCNERNLVSKSEMILALGGDGTMLLAARMVKQAGVPILGVNLGKLGFLTELSVGELRGGIDDILAGKFYIEERMALQARCSRDGKEFFALNDVVIDKGSSPRVIELETYVQDDYLVTYAADGIIVTTPTGSTAYSLASGGPIVLPQSEVITINPISPHSLTARPVIIPEDKVIRIAVIAGTMPVHITADGQVQDFYQPPIEFFIQKAPYKVRLVRKKERSYFDILRSKLLWGKDVRTER